MNETGELRPPVYFFFMGELKLTLQEIQHIAKISAYLYTHDRDEYYTRVYEPVSEAVSNNDKTVIDWFCA